MLKKITTLGLSLMLVFSAANAQSTSSKANKKATDEKVTASENAQQSGSSFYYDYMNKKLSKKALTPVNGDTLVFTDNDYPANSTIRQMVDPYDFDNDGLLNPLATAMVRKPGSLREQEFLYGDPTGYATTLAFDTVANKYNFGYGMIVTPKAGPLKGKSLVVSHGNSMSWFTQMDLTNFTASTPKTFGGNFPSIAYVNTGANAGTIWANTGASQKIYKSTDNGATFAVVDSFKHYWQYSSTGFPSEVEIDASNDGKYISMFAGLGFGGNGSSTLPKDSTDYVGWLHSEDNGATWKNDKIGYDGYNQQVTNRPSYFTYFQNFGQVEGAVDDKGVTHLAMNGYGEYPLVVGKDTLFYYAIPVLYWNSTSKAWIAVSDQKADEDTNYNSSYSSRNGFGQAYPSVSVSDDGKYVFVAWQTNEYKGTYGASEMNTYPGDGGQYTGIKYYTDIMGAYSQDGGKTFSKPFYLANKKNLAEYYASLARKLEVKNGKVTAHFVYYEDKIPGQNVLAGASSPQENGRSMGPWIYKTYTFTPTGVEDNASVVNRFDLDQNYPNPFNPTTQITYSLEKSGLVTLKVYNVLGKEVATVVNNKNEAAGKHTVSFNGSNLSSGMYIYTLTSGNTVLSKKMMLLK